MHTVHPRFTRWDEQISTKDTNEIVKSLAFWHISQVESPEGERIAGYIASDNLSALCDLDLAYGQLTPEVSYHLRQCLAFYQKRADIDVGRDRRAVAVQKFKEAEDLCLQTNDIFRKWARGGFCFQRGVDEVLHLAQRKIARILGDVPSVADLKVRFGPGATTQVTKRTASARQKLSEKFACSEEFLYVFKRCVEEMPGWVDFGDSETALLAPVIHRSKLSFVPKNAKTDRAIAVEPMLNSMFQLGIGSYMAERLRSVGIDIRDQTRNQRLAQAGSLTGELATLDLSSASDTVAMELVHHLLPPDWAVFLSHFRTGMCDTEWGPLKLQKFSSMGNGFTFPLETLLFYALAVSCVERRDESLVSVYGDDIIVPTYAYDKLVHILHVTGFIPNPSKSFSTGPFRESCGKDYHTGIDIRPCYIKDALACSSLFVLHNYYIRRGLEEPARYLLNFVSDHVKLFGPDGYGDGHLLGDWKPRPHKREIGWCGYTFDTYTFKNRRSFDTLPGDRVLPCYTIYVNEPTIGLPDLDQAVGLQRINANYGRRAAFHNVAKSTLSWNKTRWGVILPGTSGYKRISIYPFSQT